MRRHFDVCPCGPCKRRGCWGAKREEGGGGEGRGGREDGLDLEPRPCLILRRNGYVLCFAPKQEKEGGKTLLSRWSRTRVVTYIEMPSHSCGTAVPDDIQRESFVFFPSHTRGKAVIHSSLRPRSSCPCRACACACACVFFPFPFLCVFSAPPARLVVRGNLPSLLPCFLPSFLRSCWRCICSPNTLSTGARVQHGSITC